MVAELDRASQPCKHILMADGMRCPKMIHQSPRLGIRNFNVLMGLGFRVQGLGLY